MIAFLRPDSWDFPLFLHVLGATTLFGGVASLAIVSVASLRVAENAAMLRRLAFRATLFLVWPAFVVMRIGAQWIVMREHLDKDSPGWVVAGFIVADGGALALLVLTLLGWLTLRRPRLTAWFAGVSLIYFAALVVAWFAMSAKPGA